MKQPKLKTQTDTPAMGDRVTAEGFLNKLFEFEYCSNCGGDKQDHVAVIDMLGNWFAYCAKPEAV